MSIQKAVEISILDTHFNYYGTRTFDEVIDILEGNEFYSSEDFIIYAPFEEWGRQCFSQHLQDIVSDVIRRIGNDRGKMMSKQIQTSLLESAKAYINALENKLSSFSYRQSTYKTLSNIEIAGLKGTWLANKHIEELKATSSDGG